VQVGSYLGEDDILRFDDVYNRHAGVTRRAVSAPRKTAGPCIGGSQIAAK
jgi:hypothetical protein